MKFKNIYWVFTTIFTCASLGINAQCGPGDTAMATTGTLTVAEAVPAPENLTHFYKTATDTNERVIFLLPGLGGDQNAWQDVHDETEGVTYEYPTYPPRKAAVIKFGETQGPGYTEASGLASAGGEVYEEMKDVDYEDYGITDIGNNIAIGHSQGGLVGRATDYVMHRNGKTPQFGGLVTFGSAHQGAEILTNGLPVSMGGRGMLGAFGFELCDDLTEGPILEALSTSDEAYAIIIRLFNLEDEILDVKTTLCNIITSDTILKAALPDLTPDITKDYMASNEYHTASNFLLDTLNNYTTAIPMVAFFGVEEDPVVWRQLGSLSTGVHTYPAFQADPDQHYVDDVATLEAQYYVKYLIYKSLTDILKKRRDKLCSVGPLVLLGTMSGCISAEQDVQEKRAIYRAYKQGYDFLSQADDKWKAIIGARKTITHVSSTYICSCSDQCNSGSQTDYPVNNFVDCDDIEYNGGGCLDCNFLSYLQTNNTVVYKESDGIVLAESARNLPGAIVNPNLTNKDYELENTNHQQLRNSSETAIKLNRLFNTNDYSSFFITQKR